MRPRPHVALIAALFAFRAEAAPQTRSAVPVPTPRPADEPRQPQVVIVFAGGDYPANVARILLALEKAGVLETTEYTLEAGQRVCDVYRQAGLPGCSQETVALAAKLNNSPRMAQLATGRKVVAPRVDIRDYPYVVKLDPKASSDRQRRVDLERHWKGALERVESLPDGYQRLTFTGYELRVPLRSDDEVKTVLAKLRGLKLPNVLITPAFATPASHKFHSRTDPQQFWQDCVSGNGVPANEEGALALLLSSRPVSCAVTCRDNDCPDVILIDTPVLPHPDLAVGTNAPGPSPASPEPIKCRTTSIGDVNHGTHLAGIVKAAGSGHGISGVMPGVTVAGSSPGTVTLLSLDRRVPDHEIIRFIESRDPEGGLPIYLFASEWRVGDGQILRRERDRLDAASNPLGATICDLRPLWIAAAGNDSSEISRQSPLSPMNLGDQRNVVIVTACEDCTGAAPRLLDEANRAASGEPMVHLAAPGRDIPSTATATEYARASGTSQAAAFVAGVAAAMKACYPESYDRPYTVKTRLQVTSRPFPPTAAGERPDAGLTAGILDAEAALLDPNTDWLRRQGGSWEKVRVKRWPRSFELLDARTHNLVSEFNLRVSDVHRLVRFPGTADGKPDQWIAYSQVRSELGEVRRFGPGVLVLAGDGSIVELCGGESLQPQDIDDLLLAKPLEQPRACP